MAGAYKKRTDRARGAAGKWTAWYFGADGKRHFVAGTTDKATTLRLAKQLEDEARLVREGLVDPAERKQRTEALRTVADQVEDYRRSLLARGGTERHARHVSRAVARVLRDASVESVAEIAPDRVQEALGRLKAIRSARTANHALGAVKAFVRWLEHSGRIAEFPRGLKALKPYSESADRRRVRAALTSEQLGRLLAVTRAEGPTIVASRPGRGKAPNALISGPDRALLYLVAAVTGFRANELRSLTPESFDLDGDAPSVTVGAAYSKRRREDRQPIRRADAERIREWMGARTPGAPWLVVPVRTAQILSEDLRRAGIPDRDERGRVIDFHALRSSFITGLARQGVAPKILQRLARHSTITLTMDRYTMVDENETRAALEG